MTKWSLCGVQRPKCQSQWPPAPISPMPARRSPKSTNSRALDLLHVEDPSCAHAATCRPGSSLASDCCAEQQRGAKRQNRRSATKLGFRAAQGPCGKSLLWLVLPCMTLRVVWLYIHNFTVYKYIQYRYITLHSIIHFTQVIDMIYIYKVIKIQKFKYIYIALQAEDLIKQPEVQHTSLSCLHILPLATERYG